MACSTRNPRSSTSVKLIVATFIVIGLFTSGCGSENQSGSKQVTTTLAPVTTGPPNSVAAGTKESDDPTTTARKKPTTETTDAYSHNGFEDGTEDDSKVDAGGLGVATYSAAKAELVKNLGGETLSACDLYDALNVVAELPEPQSSPEVKKASEVLVYLYSKISDVLDKEGIDSAPIRGLVTKFEAVTVSGEPTSDIFNQSANENPDLVSAMGELDKLLAKCETIPATKTQESDNK